MATAPTTTILKTGVSRVFADVNIAQPMAFWSFLEDVVPVDSNSPTDYVLGEELGRGSFSEVFEATRTRDDKTVAMKRIRFMATAKIAQEVHTLKVLGGLYNTITLEGVHFDPRSDSHFLVFERVHDMNCLERMYWLSANDIRFYMMQLLQALHYCHSMGIMHRDVKPDNIVIDGDRRVLRLIDFGASDFYLPHKDYNCRVGTFAYQAPEILLQYSRYDYAVDVWAFGCILAGMIYRRMPFFNARSSSQLMCNIADVVGGQQFVEFAAEYQTEEPPCDIVSAEEPLGFWAFVTWENEQMVSDLLVELLEVVLVVNPYVRLTAAEVMKHQYFR